MFGDDFIIGFVILNYNSYNDSLKCIDYLKKIHGNKKILLVDNNSLSDNEIKNLKKLDIDLLLLDTNYGYAKGNNLGVEYLKKKYKTKLDFICVLNSDVIIDDSEFIDKLFFDYKKYNFDLLGPKILPDDSDSCNPFPVFDTIEKVDNQIKYLNKLKTIYSNKFLSILLNFYINIKHIFINIDNNKPKNGNKIMKNIAIHGCCMIFSKNYINKFNEIFYPDTFLFHEEEFIYYRMKKNNLLSLYDPDIVVTHLEEQSINKSLGNKNKKKLFRVNEQLNSLILYKKVLENENLWR